MTGRPGVAIVVPGPGVLNASAALSTSYACNTPVLLITGQVQSEHIDAGRGLLHEIPDQLGLIRHLTKWAERAMRPDQLPGLLDQAFRELQSGRRRPVSIETPPDILAMRGEVTLREPAVGQSAAAADDAIDQAAAALAAAKRPLIFSGGGVIGGAAWAELQALAELLEAPVLATQNGKGAISDRHYLSQLRIAAPILMEDADVILAVGTRFLEPLTLPWGVREGQLVIRLDIDPEEIGRVKQPDIALVGDAKPTLAALIQRTRPTNIHRPSRKEELEALKRRSHEVLDHAGPQAEFGTAIRAELPDEAIVVGEMTQVGYWANLAFPVYQPRTYLTPGYQGTLGCGFCIALGAKVGNPDRPVVSITGDGGFGFQLQELGTMAAHGIGLITIVFNDNAYGNVRRTQRQQFQEHTIATSLHNPDFLKLADSYGVTAARAATPEALRVELRKAMGRAEGTLIEVPMPEVPALWGLTLSGK